MMWVRMLMVEDKYLSVSLMALLVMEGPRGIVKGIYHVFEHQHRSG